MELSHRDLSVLIAIAAELATLNTLIKTGKLRPYLKKSEAFHLFGRNNVEKWLAAGQLTLRKDGDYSAALRIDRLEIEILVRCLEIERILPLP
jgi:hypothetical protein